MILVFLSHKFKPLLANSEKIIGETVNARRAPS